MKQKYIVGKFYDINEDDLFVTTRIIKRYGIEDHYLGKSIKLLKKLKLLHVKLLDGKKEADISFREDGIFSEVHFVNSFDYIKSKITLCKYQIEDYEI